MHGEWGIVTHQSNLANSEPQTFSLTPVDIHFGINIHPHPQPMEGRVECYKL